MNAGLSASAMVMVAAVGLAFKGIFAKLALDLGVAVVALLLLRMALSAPVYAFAVRLRARPAPALLARDRARAVLCGCLFSAATLADFVVLTLMDVGLSRAILFTYPVVVQGLSLLHDRRRPARAEWLTFALCYGGLMLMLGPTGLDPERVPLLGVMLSLLAAVSHGAYLYYGRRVSLRLGGERFAAWSNASTLLLLCAIAPFTLTLEQFSLSGPAWGWVLCLAVFSTAVPFLLLFEGMRHLDAAVASLITLCSPVITVLAAAWLFDERLSAMQLLGFGSVLIGVGALQWRPRQPVP